jgi:glutaminase
MTSSGMYDFAGEWMYRVGIPAKSGVGGGILATLPSQLGLGTFSPRLDEYGNSVRGVLVCEELSKTFGLHLLNQSSDVRASIVADYSIGCIASQRMRQPHEQTILDAHADEIRVLELAGALTFATMDYISRQVDLARVQLVFLVIDLGRVSTISQAAATLLGEHMADLTKCQVTTVFSGILPESSLAAIITKHMKGNERTRWFPTLDKSIEWAEDQVIYRYGGFTDLEECADLSKQALLANLALDEIDELTKLAAPRAFKTGERIIAAGDSAASVFFLQSGMVSVKLGNGTRLACLVPGMAFGEMALIQEPRVADVWADTTARCQELTIEQFDAFSTRYPHAGERIMHNLAALLARRLAQANLRIDLLNAH